MASYTPVEYRFAGKIRMDPETGCWTWTGCLNSRGYPLISVNGRPVLAARLAYSLQFGPIPQGANICHVCGRKDCVNPHHMALSARASVRRFREQATGIRVVGGGRTHRIEAPREGRRYTVSQIVEGKGWRHLLS